MNNKQPELHIIIGASQYDCAECAAAHMLAPPFVYIYNETTLAKYTTLPGDAIIYVANAFKKCWNSDLYEGVRKSMGLVAGQLRLFGFRDVWYPATIVKFISLDFPVTVALYYGITVEIRAKSVLLDQRGIHVLEGEVVDAS
jgi:hypothetical protein